VSIEVDRADFVGPNAERNFAIVSEWVRYDHSPNLMGAQSRRVGSGRWIGRKFGISQSAVAGVVERWKHNRAKRLAGLKRFARTGEKRLRYEAAKLGQPYRPRTSY
jgi:hypothetical protein